MSNLTHIKSLEDIIMSSEGIKLVSFLVLAAAFNNPLWTDVKGAQQTLKDARPDLKVTDVGGYCWFNSADAYKTKFKGVNPDGREIEGCVTQGLIFKGSAVRYEP
jgi:hypothetical protein